MVAFLYICLLFSFTKVKLFFFCMYMIIFTIFPFMIIVDNGVNNGNCVGNCLNNHIGNENGNLNNGDGKYVSLSVPFYVPVIFTLKLSEDEIVRVAFTVFFALMSAIISIENQHLF